MSDFRYDGFISHASEDKLDFVEPLAQELVKLGLDIWYDAFSLNIGDSLHESIERGLADSRYGIVVFSPNFFAKNWTKAELSGLFSRQMDGKKVILPIWHKITSAEMVGRYPMIADIVAIRSGLGHVGVALSLVKTIRPELLQVAESAKAANSAGKRLAAAIEEENPGYAIKVVTGSDPMCVDIAVPTMGSLASVTEGNVRTEIFLRDLSKIRGGPPQIQVAFDSVGAMKMSEAIRTGKSQVFLGSEFKFLGGNLPLMPKPDQLKDGTLEVRANLSNAPTVDVKMDVRLADQVKTVPILRLSVIRCGTSEIEFSMAHKSLPFTVNFTIANSPSESGEVELHTSFAGFSFTKIKECVDLFDDLASGADVEIFNLENGRRFIGFRVGIPADWIPRGLAELISEVAEIERHFGINVLWPSKIRDEDVARINLLHCLITGREVGTNFTATLTCEKSDRLREQIDTWRRGPTELFLEPNDNTLLSPIFDVPVSPARWGYKTDLVMPEDIDSVSKAYDYAADGECIEIKLRGRSPTFAVYVKTDNL